MTTTLLNSLIIGVLLVFILSFSSVKADDSAKDEAAIKTIVESVGSLADRGNFEALEKLYAPEIEVDYTSLAGGEVEMKSPKSLMTQWASMLPGFDRTRHEISNILVNINGKTAIATADFVADHYVEKLFWQVKGDYLYRFTKENGQWLIAAHKLNLREETGTRDVFGLASEKARQNPVSYIKRQQTVQTVTDFLVALEIKDMEKFANTLADDMVQDMPFSPEGHPKRVSGKVNIIKLFSDWPEVSGKADFTSNLRFYPMVDPEMVFVEYKGAVDIIPTGRKYLQTYGGLFHVENSKIRLFREYYDPVPFVYAFGLDKDDTST